MTSLRTLDCWTALCLISLLGLTAAQTPTEESSILYDYNIPPDWAAGETAVPPSPPTAPPSPPAPPPQPSPPPLPPLPPAPPFTGTRGGFVCLSTDDADDEDHCQGNTCGELYPNILRAGWDASKIQTGRMLAVGLDVGLSDLPSMAYRSLRSWLFVAGITPTEMDIVTTESDIANVDFSRYQFVYVPSAVAQTEGGMTPEQAEWLGARAKDIVKYINDDRGAMLVLTQTGQPKPYSFLNFTLDFVPDAFSDVSVLPSLYDISPNSTSYNVDHQFYHGYFTGPVNYGGIYQVVAYRTMKLDGSPGCPVPYGPNQDCWGTLLCSEQALLTDLDCNNSTNWNKPDCWVCGNGRTDPGEECDDGNVTSGDGCSSECKLQGVSPSPPSPSPAPPPGTEYSPPPPFFWEESSSTETSTETSIEASESSTSTEESSATTEGSSTDPSFTQPPTPTLSPPPATLSPPPAPGVPSQEESSSGGDSPLQQPPQPAVSSPPPATPAGETSESSSHGEGSMGEPDMPPYPYEPAFPTNPNAPIAPGMPAPSVPGGDGPVFPSPAEPSNLPGDLFEPPAPQAALDNEFPYCGCSRPSTDTPFSLQPLSRTRTQGSNRYCFKLSANPAVQGSPNKCASMDLRKLEFDMKPSCRGSVSAISWGDRALSSSYTTFPDLGTAVFKITNLRTQGLSNSQLNGTLVCFTLSAPCASLEDFCTEVDTLGYCRVAFFNSNLKCCPVVPLELGGERK